MRKILLGVSLCALAWTPLPADAWAAGGLISHGQAEAIGLTRAWYAQMPVSLARGRIVFMTLDKDLLLVQTDTAVVAALDAETGRTRWKSQVGKANYPSLAPGANEKTVAVVNGSTLYVLDRLTGELKWKRMVPGVPGAGPALSATHAFVPMLNGTIEGYVLDDSAAPPWVFNSFGHTFVQPIVTPKTVSWTTDLGHYYVAATDEVRILYRLETREAIDTQPAYWPPYLYAASRDGFLYAVHEKTGHADWKFSVGEPIRQPPAAVSGKVYVVPERGGMFALDAANGKRQWFASGATQFLSASAQRVYAFRRDSTVAALDAKSGRALGAIAADGIKVKLVNGQTDRVYLATEGGIVQCLREIDRREPLRHEPPVIEAPPAEPKKTPRTAPAAPPRVQPEEEPAPPAEPAPADDNPFAPAEAEAPEPAKPEKPADDADPFGE
jgi:outer membrane protein assembly factor BamB